MSSHDSASSEVNILSLPLSFLRLRLQQLLWLCVLGSAAQLWVFDLWVPWVGFGILIWLIIALVVSAHFPASVTGALPPKQAFAGTFFLIRYPVLALLYCLLAGGLALKQLPTDKAIRSVEMLTAEAPAQSSVQCKKAVSIDAIIRRCGALVTVVGRIRSVRFVGEDRVKLALAELWLSDGETGQVSSIETELTHAELPWDAEVMQRGENVRLKLKLLSIREILEFLEVSTAESKEASEKREEGISHLRRKFREGIVAKGVVESHEAIGPHYEAVSRSIAFQTALFDRVKYRDALALVLTASLGNGALLSKDIFEAFRETGTLHLIVVSGFHLGLVCLVATSLFARLWTVRLHRFSKISADSFGMVFGVGASLIFVSFAEYSLPMMRAVVFLIVYTLNQIFHRFATGWELICYGYLALLLVEPGAFLTPSLQLTTAALLGLQAAPELSRQWRARYSGLTALSIRVRTMASRSNVVLERYLLVPLLTALSVFIMTAPVLWFWFQELRPVSIIWNVLLGPPFTAVVIFGGLFGILVSSFSSALGQLVLFVVLPLVDLLLQAVQFAASMPFNILLSARSEGQFGLLFFVFAICAVALTYFSTVSSQYGAVSGFGSIASHSD